MFTIDMLIGLIRQFWKPALAVVVLIAILGFVWSWHSRGEKLEKAKVELATANELAREWQETSRECAVATLKLEATNKLLEQRLADALAATPATVIKYRDRVKVVDNLVISDDCPTAVAQMAQQLAGLPVCGGEP